MSGAGGTAITLLFWPLLSGVSTLGCGPPGWAAPGWTTLDWDCPIAETGPEATKITASAAAERVRIIYCRAFPAKPLG